MKTIIEMKSEVESIKPFRSPGGQLHAPVRVVDAEHPYGTVVCSCKSAGPRSSVVVPIDQPYPSLYVGLETFKLHLVEVQDAAVAAAEKQAADALDELHKYFSLVSVRC